MSTQPGDLYTDGYRAAEDGKPKPAPARPAVKPDGRPRRPSWINPTVLALAAASCLGLFHLFSLQSQVNGLAVGLEKLQSDLAQYRETTGARLAAIEERSSAPPGEERARP